MSQIEFTDRYKALGIPYPEADTMCRGQCEGTGWVPETEDDSDPRFVALWREAHATSHQWRNVLRVAWKHKDIKWLWKGRLCDGWHFVRCPDCHGTGKHQTA